MGLAALRWRRCGSGMERGERFVAEHGEEIVRASGRRARTGRATAAFRMGSDTGTSTTGRGSTGCWSSSWRCPRTAAPAAASRRTACRWLFIREPDKKVFKHFISRSASGFMRRACILHAAHVRSARVFKGKDLIGNPYQNRDIPLMEVFDGRWVWQGEGDNHGETGASRSSGSASGPASENGGRITMILLATGLLALGLPSSPCGGGRRDGCAGEKGKRRESRMAKAMRLSGFSRCQRGRRAPTRFGGRGA